MNHYIVLDVKPDATGDEIKKAYRTAASKTHPDRGGMTHMFRMVQEAYETLSDPDKRTAYDREIGLAPEPVVTEPEDMTWDSAGSESMYEADPEEAHLAPPRKRFRPAMVAWAVVVLAVGGYWIVQDITLLGLTQPKSLYRLYVPNGTPAVVYFVLWALGTLAVSVADDWFSAMKVPVVCTLIAGLFAFITATGTFPVWALAMGTGLALTLVIALPLQLRRAVRG